MHTEIETAQTTAPAKKVPTFEQLLTSLYGADAEIAFDGHIDSGRERRMNMVVGWGKRDADGVAEFEQVLVEDVLTTGQAYVEARAILEARIAKRDAEPFRRAVELAAHELFGTDARVTVGEAEESGDEAWAAELIIERRRVNFPEDTHYGPTPIVALAQLLTAFEIEHANRTTAVRASLDRARKAAA